MALSPELNLPHPDMLVAANAIFEGMIIVDISQRIIFLNPAAERLSGWSIEEARGRQSQEIFNIGNALDHQRTWDPVGQALRTNTFYTLLPSSTLITRDGSEIPIEDSVSPIRNKQGAVTGAVILFKDISASRLLLINALHQAQHDELTHLPNRNLLKDRLQQAMFGLQDKRHSVALLFIDVDKFKQINDEHGHTAGDEILQVISRRLSGSVRRVDTVSRFGGDEFVVLLPEVSGVEDAMCVAEKLRKCMDDPVATHGRMVQVPLSIGVAVCSGDCLRASMMEDADSAMYQAKRSGGNRVHLFASTEVSHARRRLSLEEELYSSLAEDRFVLHYQPQVDLASGHIVGAEGLLRWKTTEGFRLPGDFIHAAERCGLIVPIGELVLRKAIQQQNRWRKSGRAGLMLSVNVSPVELRTPGYSSTLAALLREEGYARDTLMLEVTESESLRADEGKIVLDGICEEGLRLGLDDFGMGYSSMSYLRLFPFDAIKIERSFVVGATTSAQGLALLTALTSMARSLSKHLIAEGIETQEQRRLLQTVNCSYGQGFLFGPAVSAEEFEHMLSQGM